MEDGVRYIFKTLLRVPVIIVIMYAVMNVFFFAFIYFKCLGISYVVMQTAVENNYIPQTELKQLCKYMYDINQIPFVGGNGLGVDYTALDGKPQAGVVIAESSGHHYIAYWDGSAVRYWNDGSYNTSSTVPTTISDGTKRHQYGSELRVGIACNYHMIWPLMYKQTIAGSHMVGSLDTGGQVGGFQGGGGTGAAGSGYVAQPGAGMSDPLIRGVNGGGIKGLRGGTGVRQYDLVMLYDVPGLKYYPDMINY